MKRSERHHLKDNEFVSFLSAVQQQLEEKTTLILAVAAAIVVALVAGYGYSSWRGGLEGRAAAALVEASVIQESRVGPPPADGAGAPAPAFATERERSEVALARMQALADEYPSTDAGRTARYRAGSLLMSLGRPVEAEAAFQQVADGAGSSVLGQMARFGLAEAQALAGDYDKAIAAYETLAAGGDASIPTDGVLMQLGRVYRSAGRTDDAQKTFTRVVEEFPTSPFVTDARQELDALGGRQPDA
jgi:TolA-binding protein